MNPGLTQLQFTYVGTRLFYLLGKLLELRQHRFRYERNEVRVEDVNDFNANTSSWVLYGVNPGVNTDANGELFVRCVASGGDWIVTLFLASGGGAGDRVAVSGVTADGATATFTALNGYGISGTCLLDATVVAEIDDVHKLRCFTDYPVRDVQVFEGTESFDATLRPIVLASNIAVADALKAAEASLVDAFRQCLIVYVASRINAASSIPLDKGYDVEDGAVSLIIKGILEDLRLAMIDNTTPQSITQAVIAAGSVAFASGNVGLGTMVTPTMLEKALPGTITWRCSDETLGSEQFLASLRRSDDGSIVEGKNPLYVGKEWKDADIGVSSAVLLRSLSKTGDGTNIYFSVLSSGWSVTGESTSNTNNGVLYPSIVANGGAWDISFYKSSARLSTDLVAKATSIANNAVFSAVAQRRSGLTVNGTAGSAMAAWSSGTLLLNAFKSGPPADVFTSAVTRTSAGDIQKFLAELIPETLDWYLKGSGSPTLPDTLMTRGVTTLYGRN